LSDAAICCARRLPHEAHRQLDEQINEVKRMLNSFLQKFS
jgi:hypothetical protein